MALEVPIHLPKADTRLRSELEGVQDELERKRGERPGAKKRETQAHATLREAERELEAAERAIARLEEKAKELKHKLTR